MGIAMNEAYRCGCCSQIFCAMLAADVRAGQVQYGVCGCCTVLFNGEATRSCLMFAVQADGMAITTIEGMAGVNSELHPIQQAFREKHGLQCGFCTPGIIMTVHAMLHEHPDPTEDEIRHELSGNICRCTGYQNIVEAVKLAAERLRAPQMEVE